MDSLVIDIILFLVGFFILIKGADLMISGSVKLARFINMSEWLIGVVIVGIGTSLPELAINLNAALDQNPIGISTIIGSNIFNMLVILGLVAFVSPLVFHRTWVTRDILINIASIVITMGIILLPSISSSVYTITRPESLILLTLFVIWMIFMVRRRDDTAIKSHREADDTPAWSISLLLIIVGIVGVIVGGKFVVDGAVQIAEMAGISKGLIGLTLVAIGTSIPEIAVSFRAIIRKRTGIAVGNIIGSNIFDLLGVIGLSALIAPLTIPSFLIIDFVFLLITASALYLFMIVGKTNTISRLQGLFLLLLYFAYLTWIIIRG